MKIGKIILAVTIICTVTNSSSFSQNNPSSYFKNFVYHSNGSFCYHTNPAATFTAYLNNDESKILIENAPRWEMGADPNIAGNGTFGVELGNFINPPLQIGDSVYIRFTDNATGQQGTLSDYCTAIPWARFPLSLYLTAVVFPSPPENVNMVIDSLTGYRTVSWNFVAGLSYTVYRRTYQETLPNGECRMLYHRIAQNLSSGSFTDSTTELNKNYGYIVYAVNSSGIKSSHSAEANEDPAPGTDLTVGFIARLPRIDYIWGSPNPAVEGWPAVDDTVIWQINIRNWAEDDYSAVHYKWLLDGVDVDSGTVPMFAQSDTTVDFPWVWTFDRHELKFIIDPDDLIQEEEEQNNEQSIYTNAISVGFYVEQSVYDYFHQYQKYLNVHSNCWEDWAQRHVKIWNQMFAGAIFPETPDGVLDRIRIDDIHIVPDDALPLAGGLATNTPNLDDRTVDLQWGFPAVLLNGGFYSNHTSPNMNNPFYFEGSLMHELGHARYLIDVYGFDVNDDGTGNSVAIKENGQLIVGTPYMPMVGGGVYHTPIHGLMNGQYTYVDHYSAVAMNLIAGHRATYGNYNAPNNIGVFMQDLPLENILTIKNESGEPLQDASIEIYQAEGLAGVWYGKYYDDIPDIIELQTDSLGRVAVGRCPFDDDGTIEHDYGRSNVMAIIRVEKDGLIGYTFLEASSFNFEYWRGNTQIGNEEINVHLINPLDVKEIHETPTEFVLEQNYPNPFNPVTKIVYQIPEASNVKVKVYDILGREIKTLVDEYQSSGSYSVYWDGKNNQNLDMSSGVYFYRLESSSIILTKKMILLR